MTDKAIDPKEIMDIVDDLVQGPPSRTPRTVGRLGP